MDIVLIRGLERILIILGAIFVSYLGYKLYLNGHLKGANKLQVKAEFMNFIISGQGAGLLFMALGALIMIFSIYSGKLYVEAESDECDNVVYLRTAPISPMLEAAKNDNCRRKKKN